MKPRVMFRVDRQDWTETLQLRFACRSVDSDSLALATQVVFKTVPYDAAVAEEDAPISMSRDEAASLMAELWNAGIRPPSCLSGNDEREALHAHIADLRKIIDALLPKVAP